MINIKHLFSSPTIAIQALVDTNHRRDIIPRRVIVTVPVNRQLVRKACLYSVGLALTLCPPLSGSSICAA